MNTTPSRWSRWSTASKAMVAAVTMTAILGAGAAGLELTQGAHPGAGGADTATRTSNGGTVRTQESRAGTAAAPVPGPLNDIEAQTEDIFDQVPQNT